MKKYNIIVCISLSLTNLSFFQIGLAEFTLFHALILGYLATLLLNSSERGVLHTGIPLRILYLVTYVTIINIAFINSIKLSSYIYTLIIVAELVLLYRLVKTLELDEIKTIVKGIILIYFISITIGYLLINLKITPIGILGNIFQIYDDQRKIVRPGGLSSEPSYAAIILVFTLYVLMRCGRFTFNIRESMWYILCSIAVILTGSSYGYLLLAILIAFYAIKSNVVTFILSFIKQNRATGLALILILAAGISNKISSFFNTESVQRIVNILEIFTTFNGDLVNTISTIARVDSSAGMRLLPTFQLMEYWANTNFMFVLFGRGAAQSTEFFSQLYAGELTMLGFIPAFVYNYGLVGVLITALMLNRLFPKKKAVFSLLFVLSLLNADFNTQIFTFIVFAGMLAKRTEILEY